MAGDLVPGFVNVMGSATRPALATGATGLPVSETDQWFRILAESTSTAIFVYRAERFLYVNPACEVVTGYSAEELLERVPWDLSPPESQDFFRDRAAARLAASGCRTVMRRASSPRTVASGGST